ncbi:MAG: BACON domain-containing protein, partial [Bacteroidales bacterium]|nr:BACON domain-containing protein [Bacteroidales bacterium]
YSLNGVTDGGSVDPEDPSKVEQITCAEFISKADPNTTYRLVGKVTSSVNEKYCSFDMNDGTATVVVWTVNNASDWSSKVKQGGTVTVRGKYLRYENNGSVKHEMVDAYIEAFTEGSDQPAETVTGTVAQTIAANDATNVVIPESTVMAISKQGIVVSDGTANVYLYFDAKNNETVPSVAIGDKVKVEAEKATYGGVPEFKAPKVTKLSSGGAVTYPESKDLNPIAASYNSNVTEFVKMTGTLKISGNYVNLEMDGVDSNSKMGSVSAPLDALGASSFDGKKVTVKGYFSGITGSGKYINMVATEIVPADPDAKYCNVSPASISAKADDTSASFSISSNAAWTATSDNADFTLSPASGTGDATVTVSFAANSGDAPKVANITVACADAGVNATVTITQAKPSSGEALTISVDFTKEDANLPQASANGKQDGTYTVDGYTFTLHAADKYYQAKSNDSYYLLIGKKDSYIQFPAIEGKALTKVQFLTGAAASENVIGDIAKADGTRLNVNDEKLKKGTDYSWDVAGEPGAAYRFVVTNAYNAQFQKLTLIYE